jgi:hypothetical protein
MSTELEENQSGSVNEVIEAITTHQIESSTKTLVNESQYYRSQEGEHGGSGVFFNPDGQHTRYGLTDGNKGSLYVADDPNTSMKELLQNIPFIEVADLDKYHIARLVTEKELKVVDITKLAPKISITANQLTDGDYKTTQKLAKKLSLHADGLMYVSNVTLKSCLVLWHAEKSGRGVIRTEECTMFSKFEHNGSKAEDILVNDLDILVV